MRTHIESQGFSATKVRVDTYQLSHTKKLTYIDRAYALTHKIFSHTSQSLKPQCPRKPIDTTGITAEVQLSTYL